MRCFRNEIGYLNYWVWGMEEERFRIYHFPRDDLVNSKKPAF